MHMLLTLQLHNIKSVTNKKEALKNIICVIWALCLDFRTNVNQKVFYWLSKNVYHDAVSINGSHTIEVGLEVVGAVGLHFS